MLKNEEYDKKYCNKDHDYFHKKMTFQAYL